MPIPLSILFSNITLISLQMLSLCVLAVFCKQNRKNSMSKTRFNSNASIQTNTHSEFFTLLLIFLFDGDEFFINIFFNFLLKTVCHLTSSCFEFAWTLFKKSLSFKKKFFKSKKNEFSFRAAQLLLSSWLGAVSWVRFDPCTIWFR